MNQNDLILDHDGIDRALTRIAEQIIARNGNATNLGMVGMQSRGVFMAQRIATKLAALTGITLMPGTLDITLYRDDYLKSVRPPELRPTDIPFDINDRDIILVDDVLFTGRTIRAGLDALMDFGRPRSIQLAVLVDRGNRELPIQADYCGIKVPTERDQRVSLSILEMHDRDELRLSIKGVK